MIARRETTRLTAFRFSAAPNQSSFHHYRDLVSQFPLSLTDHTDPAPTVVLRHPHPHLGALRHQGSALGEVRPPYGHVEAPAFPLRRLPGYRYSHLLSERSLGLGHAGVSPASSLFSRSTKETLNGSLSLRRYKWHQIEIGDVDRKPGYVQLFSPSRSMLTVANRRARSGFSFLPCADGLILHGKHLALDHQAHYPRLTPCTSI